MEDNVLTKLSEWKSESETLLAQYHNRWQRNIKLWKGRFRAESAVSDVRKREKLFFRKIWATGWRMLASMYNAYLKDPDSFDIEGRDTLDDPRKAKVLKTMTQFRRDRMLSRGLFLKLIWAFMDIIQYGWCCGKLSWVTRNGRDEPEFILYPPEQVFPDMTAETREEMRYIHFLNYLSEDDIRGYGYKNADKLTVGSVESNEVRQARHENEGDPLQNPDTTTNYAGFDSGKVGGEYPSSGRYQGGEDKVKVKRYPIYESFWKQDGKVKFVVHHNFETEMTDVMNSPYGDEFPDVMGLCFTESHKLIGEGLPEPLEGPQESYNYFLNMRQDNVAHSMTGHTIVSRYGNVDLDSVINRTTAGYTMADDVNAVRHEDIPDVTQTAYMEAGATDAMMQEMSGITAGKMGMENADKATVAQINYSESNAKIDLFLAIVGETFIKNFYHKLAYLIQRFENDETIFRIANEKLRQDGEMTVEDEVYDLGFEADCTVKVGMGTVGKEIEIRNTLLAMDRGIMTMQAAANLMKMGISPPEGIKVPNISKFMEDLLPNIGKKNLKEYFITLPPPQGQPGGEGGGGNGGLQPQVGDMGFNAGENMLQEGSLGGL